MLEVESTGRRCSMKGKERKGKERKGKERKGKERKGKERKSIYIAALFWPRWYTQSAQAWIIQFYLQITPYLPLTKERQVWCYLQVKLSYLPFLRERSPEVTTTATEAADIQLQLRPMLYRWTTQPTMTMKWLKRHRGRQNYVVNIAKTKRDRAMITTDRE